MSKTFITQASDINSDARAGFLHDASGRQIETPFFQPVATAASLKTLDWGDLKQIGYQHVLMNTYHLVVRPGIKSLESIGGVKQFSNWQGSVLTDSGGYQAHSLAARVSLKPDGLHFTDHIAGNRWHFSPRFTMEAQLAFGVDFAMAVDVCTGLPATRNKTARDMELTHSWAKEQSELWPELRGDRSTKLFGIVQGGLMEDLRQESIELISSLDFDGIAVGGLAVGEEKEDLERLVAYCGPKLPEDKVHYLMGLGEPADLLFAVAHGFDMFDCVQPTRMARHGTAYTRQGKLKLKQKRFENDRKPLDSACRCSTCRTYTRQYLRHLLMLKEHSYARLLTIHNLYFYRDLFKRIRNRISAGNYAAWWPRHYKLMNQNLPDRL